MSASIPPMDLQRGCLDFNKQPSPISFHFRSGRSVDCSLDLQLASDKLYRCGQTQSKEKLLRDEYFGLTREAKKKLWGKPSASGQFPAPLHSGENEEQGLSLVQVSSAFLQRPDLSAERREPSIRYRACNVEPGNAFRRQTAFPVQNCGHPAGPNPRNAKLGPRQNALCRSWRCHPPSPCLRRFSSFLLAIFGITFTK